MRSSGRLSEKAEAAYLEEQRPLIWKSRGRLSGSAAYAYLIQMKLRPSQPAGDQLNLAIADTKFLCNAQWQHMHFTQTTLMIYIYIWIVVLHAYFTKIVQT
jgi:hypothetical protein